MYIKLNTIRIKYLRDIVDNYIVSEVVDSTMSYEKPIIVRTVNELDSWFGTNFSSYDYFVELLNQNISLYLYKPVNTELIKTDNYVDIDNYSIDPGVYPTKDYLETTVLDPDQNTKYRVGSIDIDWNSLATDDLERHKFPEEPEPNTKYNINGVWYTYINDTWYSKNDIPGEYYIYLNDSWVSESNLPQNTEKTSISQENRDTLLIAKPNTNDNSGYSGTITYCYPEYHESKLGIYSDLGDPVVNVDQNYPMFDPESNLNSTYVFDFNVTDPENFLELFWSVTYSQEQPEGIDPAPPDFDPTLPVPNDYRINDRIYTFDSGTGVYTIYTVTPLNMKPYYMVLYSTWLVPEINWSELNPYSGGDLTEFPSTHLEDTKYRINGTFWTWCSPLSIWISENDIPGKPVRYLFYNGDVSDIIPESFIPEPRRVAQTDEMELLINLRDQLGYSFEYTLAYPNLPTDITPGKKCYYKDENGYVRLYTKTPSGWNSEDVAISLYSPISLLVEYGYNIPGAEVIPNEKKSQILLTKNLEESNWGIEVWSKTIGKSDPEYNTDLIELQIVEISNKEIYQITVTRFGYSEIYEGTIKPKTGEEERLDYRISRESNLINIYFDDISCGLRTGKWTLRGSEVEEYSPSMYWKSLELMLNQDQDSIIPDYLLIPKKEYWTTDISDQSYLLRFLGYAKTYSFQVLIQNNGPKYIIDEVLELPEWNKDIPENILFKINDIYWRNNGTEFEDFSSNTIDIEVSEHKGDFIYNYLDDRENRLVYFFLGMTVLEKYRPSYYLYLLGWSSDIYSKSTKYINYANLMTNPYEDSEFEKQLENYKSNYLVCNNQLYYYKKYQDGKNYISTGWMRFAIGRITRDLQRYKWNYLAKKSKVDIGDNIKNILKDIVIRFSIIDYIEVVSLQFDDINQKLYIKLETGIKDLINNNISLDITINYKEE